MKTLAAVVLVGVGLTACNCGSNAKNELAGLNDAPLDTPDDVRRWASGSAPNVYFSAVFFTSLSDDLADGGPRTCPRQSVEGGTRRIEGGCTDEDGERWFGTLEVVDSRDAGGSSGYTSRDYGHEGPKRCLDGGTVMTRISYSGQFSLTGDEGNRTFSVDLVVKGTGYNEAACITATIDSATSYSGSVRDDTWSGSGQIGYASVGKAQVETKDEVIANGACGSEAVSGTTTVKSGQRTAVITYDAQSPCNTATWSLDGVDRGALSGVTCAAAPVGLLPLVALLLLARRRRTAAPPQQSSERG